LPPETAHNSLAPTDGDAALLRRFLAGERAAFEQLYDRHDVRCLDFIRRLLAGADEATAEDLHQEVWIAVAHHGAGFDENKAGFVTWLFTIARNKVMDHFRQKQKVVRLAADLGDGGEKLLEDWPAAPESTPECVAHNRQLADALLNEVRALPFVQREAFLLFAQHELSLEAVAQVTQVGLETAKSRLRYARQALRQRLAAWRSKHV
jgi:RNA polymerase sigma-70 factor (ECF subfamily)